jgi:threonine 3-dehydrogenase
MDALVYDRELDPWDRSTGLRKLRVPTPRLDPAAESRDESAAIVRVLYAGFCGTDRGIWFRKSLKDLIFRSLDEESKSRRITGHEMLGEVVAVGPRAALKYGFRPGEVVSTESHVICGACYQCRHGDTHVCAEERIIGISMDGCFAQYLKIPAKALWRTDLGRIRPEVAAIQEPFGNAVHACTKVDLKGRSVAIFGTGAIGMFAALVARGLGARRIVGVEPNPQQAEMARRLGIDEVIVPDVRSADPVAADPKVAAAVRAATDGVGADVTLEMSGQNSAFNNAIESTRRGGHVVLFGLRDGRMVIDRFSPLVMNGIELHAVVGRRIFETWDVTRALMEDRSNGIQDRVWDVILDQGRGTVTDLATWDKSSFEKAFSAHPKNVIRIGGEPVVARS